MSQYVIIGTAPTIDVSVGVGPFRSAIAKPLKDADGKLTALGYNTEVVELFRVDDIEPVATWEE